MVVAVWRQRCVKGNLHRFWRWLNLIKELVFGGIPVWRCRKCQKSQRWEKLRQKLCYRPALLHSIVFPIFNRLSRICWGWRSGLVCFESNFLKSARSNLTSSTCTPVMYGEDVVLAWMISSRNSQLTKRQSTFPRLESAELVVRLNAVTSCKKQPRRLEACINASQSSAKRVSVVCCCKNCVAASCSDGARRLESSWNVTQLRL